MSETYKKTNWINWVTNNLNNGVQPSVICEAMIKKGINKEEAYILVLKCLEQKDNFFYETPRINIEGNFVRADNKKYRILSMLSQPLVIVIENFLSEEECDFLINLSKEKLKPSEVIDGSTGESVQNSARTCKAASLSIEDHKEVSLIDTKIANFMNCPLNNGEKLQIIKYQVDDIFKEHFDFLPNNLVKKETGGQRISTFITYLNDVEEGGATTFPNVKFSVAPKKGVAVYFEYYNSKGQINPLTLHSGDAVKRGEKWIAAKFMREYSII